MSISIGSDTVTTDIITSKNLSLWLGGFAEKPIIGGVYSDEF